MSDPKFTTLDPKWEPSPTSKAWHDALTSGVTKHEWDQQRAQFSYFYGIPGEKMADWEAAWRWWLTCYIDSTGR